MALTITNTLISNESNHLKNSGNKAVTKPQWDPKKAYTYLEDMSEASRAYKKKAIDYYRYDSATKDMEKPISAQELKDVIKQYFPQYTFTNREPKDPVAGKHYLYIDDSQLNKMASDPGYRARVFGLMDSELQGTKGYTLKYSDGRSVTNYLTGTVFSLAESNRSIKGVGQLPGSEGIPYHGSCTGSTMPISSGSHPQVRSQSFLDNITESNAQKSQSNTIRETAKKLAKKRADKRKIEAKEAKKAVQKRIEERIETKREMDEVLMERFMSTGGQFDAMA